MEQEQNRHENAVSPVIGVMLMIVVTIIIAAVVSAFAGGFADDQKKTPSAQIDVQIQPVKDSSVTYTGWGSQVLFTHKGGDPIKTRDLLITVWDQNGDKHVTDGRNTSILYPCKFVNGNCPDAGAFGNTTWMNGDILATNSASSTATILGSGTLSQGTVVTVDIVYIPSNDLIFHKDVMAS